MDKLIENYEIRLIEPECAPGSARYGALVIPPKDISEVFPYLNEVQKNAWYDHANKVLILREPEQAYALRPNEIRIARVKEQSHAEELAHEIIEKINEAWAKRDKIKPRFEERKTVSVIDIYKLLPKTNCKQCGYATCLAFAADLRQGMVQIEQCLPLCEPEHAEKIEKMKQLTNVS